jgi:hypothetical protein
MTADVREKHGCVSNGGDKAVIVNEREECINIVVNDGFGTRSIFLTPNEARYVASKLRRLSRRVDERVSA